MVPLWLCTLGAVLMRDVLPTYSVPIPWRALVVLGLIFGIPVVLGGVFRRVVRDRVAVVASMVIRLFGVLGTLVGIAGTLYCNTWIFDYVGDDWRLVAAVCIFSYVSCSLICV